MLAIIKRDIRIAQRQPSEWANPLIFFIIVCSLFPLAIKPEANTLQSMAPAIIWVGVLLANLLSLDRLFRSDFEDGSLDQLLISKKPFASIVLAKIIAHWLLTGLPIIIICPILALLLHLDQGQLFILIFSLLLGTPILSLLGAMCAALTLILRRGGMVLSLLTLPLYMPVLIFGAGALFIDHSTSAAMAMLGAMLALTLTFIPFLTASTIKAVVRA